ncbi:chemotaxis protein CheB [Croceivirga radicis]|uniref:chemotaxis protein CheB n=1 Tax=Croceivirga radicis TaxID=1929488 RepID=UPI000255B8BC|nr:chemotaxis protein CheB [Croceivirga radicis]
MGSKQDGFMVVAIGASAGGLQAVHSFFDAMPASPNMTFIVVQHLAPNFKSLMPELLASHTKMKIFVAEENQEIKPNCIYLNNKDNNLGIEDGKFILLKKAPRKQLNLPIDIIFKMVANAYKENAVGVVLSGTGSDGSKGIYNLKEVGATIYAQDPKTAEFDGMPKSAIHTNCVDFILPPQKIAENILWLANQERDFQTLINPQNATVYDTILTKLYKHSGIDFSKYKPNTLIRRMNKRMSLFQLNSLDVYYQYLLTNEEELKLLSQSFLIGVTSFFRNVEAFNSLKLSVIPELFANRMPEETIRIWIPGCSTGKEVYSIAFFLEDYIQTKKIDLDFKIFATDIDKQALKKAGIGVFGVNDISEIGEEYLTKYFVKKGDRFQIIKRIREKIIFSYHDLTNDPPFIQIDLISCRNLLIYLNKETKEKVINAFEFSLNKNGFLFLGNSESLAKAEQNFTVVNGKHKIYRIKKGRKLLENNALQIKNKTHSKINYLNLTNKVEQNHNYTARKEVLFYKHLSKKHAPVTVYVNQDYDVIFMLGDFQKWFSQNDGIFNNNLLHLVNPELASIIRNGIRRAKTSDKTISYKKLSCVVPSGQILTDLFVERVQLEPNGDFLYMLQFGESIGQENTEEVVLSNEDISTLAQQQIDDLEYELSEKKEALTNITEELETSNEELQSSNEELMSSNEELQSSNEELQSVNEELYTVNTEFQEKNKELEELNNDMNNLLDSTDIGTLFLDEALKIRKFTPALKKVFKLESQDIGRPIFNFSSVFEEEARLRILNKSKDALTTFNTFEEQLLDSNGNWYLIRISPFVTKEKRISGVVITFVDITEIKKAEEELKLKTRELTIAQEVAKLGSWTLNIATNEVYWSEELFKMYGLDPEDGVPDYDDENHRKLFTPKSWATLEKAVSTTIETGKPYTLELRSIRNDGSKGWMYAVGRVLKNEEGKTTHLQGIAQDITERKQLRSKLQKADEFAGKMTRLSPSGMYIYDMVKGSNVFMNEGYTNILGYTPADIEKLSPDEFFNLFHPEDQHLIEKHMAKVLEGKLENIVEYRFKHKNGKWVWCYSIDSPFEKDDEGKVTSFFGVFIDVTQKKENEEKLKKALVEANSANIYKNQFLANMSHEIRTPLNGLVGFSNLLRDHDLNVNDKKEYISIIENCSQQLLSLVDDIIDLSKIEAGELDMEFMPCELNHLVRELEMTFNEIKKQQEKDNLEIKTFVPNPNVPLNIKTDPNRLKQVLINLVNNAIKFTDSGSVTFGYAIKGDWVEFKIKDTGIGIAEENLKLIFERFERIGFQNNDKYSGKGLGLSISKGIIGLLGGDIDVSSKLGVGSEFTFTIPFTLVETVKPMENKSSVKQINKLFNDQKILVADDNRINRHYLKTLLKRTNLLVDYAENGEEAVSMFRQKPDYDIVLMDIRMPVMDGFEAKEEIVKINPNAKVIAQTAHAMSNDREQCLSKGFVDYIAKPLGKEDLFEVIAKWI